MDDPLWVKENQLAELILLVYVIINDASRILLSVRGQGAWYVVVCNLYL